MKHDRPIILVDSREQAPLPVGRYLPTLTAGLQTGDYSLLGFEHDFAVERKSIADLTGSLVGVNRERFERELHRLRGFRFKRLLVVGDPEDIQKHRYRSKIPPKSVFATLAAYEMRFDLPVIWQPGELEAARLVARWGHFFHREMIRPFKKVASCSIDHAAGSSTLQLIPSS
jgi:ERCC4-type nuclease